MTARVIFRRSTVIVVAEGYARALRKELREQPGHELSLRGSEAANRTTTSGRPEFEGLANAAEFLHWQLRGAIQ